MSWEAVAALASAASAIILAATGIFIARQVRAAADQMDLQKRSTQLDGMMRIMAMIDSAEFRASQKYIMTDLDGAMRDPSFDPANLGADQPWRPALSTLERLGVYIRLGYLDGEPFHYNLARPIIVLWQHLHPLIEKQRRAHDNPYLWKDTEWLAADALEFSERWTREHPLPRPSTGEPFVLEPVHLKPVKK